MSSNNFVYNSEAFNSSYEKTTLASNDLDLAMADATTAKTLSSLDFDILNALNSAVSDVESCKRTMADLNIAFSKWEGTIYNLVTEGYMNSLLLKLGDPTGTNFASIKVLTEEYMKEIIRLYGNRYGTNTEKFRATTDPLKDLIAAGMPIELVNNLSLMMCQSLSQEFYTREGIVSAAYLYTGILAAYGLRLKYQLGGSFKGKDDFYFGSADSRSGMLDCVNYVKVLYRCIGIDPVAGSAVDFANYAIKSGTDKSQILIGYGNDYFLKGQAGDILSSSGHVMLILENDGEGYYYTEESGYGAVIQYKKYKDFGADNGWGPFYLTNMESLFNNTTLYLANGSKPEYNGSITGSPGRYDNNVFIPPEKYKEIYPDISDEAIVAMQENYDANNNWDQRVEYVPRVIEPPKPGTIDDYENPKDDSVKPTPGDNNPVIPDINDPITPPKSDVTILPDNKYNDAFPILTDGTLGYCEISDHHVLYEISGIDIDSYNNYILKIKEFGYKLNEDESMWIKDNYALTITIKDNNIIQIMAQIINGM